jgi:signal transduction histidine kinase
LETETKERRILARDLHDGLGGMLSLLRMKTEQGEPSLPLIDSIHTELRRTAHHLMPEELLRNGLVSALNDFAVSVPNAKFQAIGDIRLDKDKELTLYRCAYELVNNAMKYAEAEHIDIQLMQDEKEITLTVSDNGKGMTEENSGMGLQNDSRRDRYLGHTQAPVPVTIPMLIFGFTALGAALTAIIMLYVDRKKSYGLQLPNIKKV